MKKWIIFAVSMLPFLGWSQPDPRWFYPDRIQGLSSHLEKFPEDDSSRLVRAQLSIAIDRNPSAILDLDILLERLENNQNTFPVTHFELYTMYAECYEESDLRLSINYYKKALKIREAPLIYRHIMNLYYNLGIIDSAMIYNDTLEILYTIHSRSADASYVGMDQMEFFALDRIKLLKTKLAFSEELVDLYNRLSRQHFDKCRELLAQEPDRSDYTFFRHREMGFMYQFEATEYFLSRDSTERARDILLRIKNYLPVNKFGDPIQRYEYLSFYSLYGEILYEDGERLEAFKNLLIGNGYLGYDTLQTWTLLEENPEIPEAHLLHAQTKYNYQLHKNWQSKSIHHSVLERFEKAYGLGCRDYRIYLARANQAVYDENLSKAMEIIDSGLKVNPKNYPLRSFKGEILRKQLFSGKLSEANYEKLNADNLEILYELRKDVVVDFPHI